MPQSFDGLLGSLGVLLTSNMMVAVLTLGTLALTSHALSPAGLGLLALIEIYARMFDQVLRLEPSQALIRMAMPHRDAPNSPPFRRLVRFGIVLDTGGSLLAAGVALACLPFVGAWFGFDQATGALALLYCLTLFVPAPMTANVLFRLFGRFRIYARNNLLVALLRLAGSAALYLSGAGLREFVLLLCATTVLERLLPSVMCWFLLRRMAVSGINRTPLAGVVRDNPGLWRFILASNISVLARNSTRHFDVAALAGFITPAELGLYVLAKRFAILVIRVGSPTQLVVYPRMCELVAQGSFAQLGRFVLTFFLIFVCLSACGLAALTLIGEPLILYAFGSAFVPAGPLVLIQLAGACLLLTGTIFNSALQALHRAGQAMSVSIIAAAVFFLPIPFLVPEYGVLAASYLNLLVGLTWAAGCGLMFLRALRASPPDGQAARQQKLDLPSFSD